MLRIQNIRLPYNHDKDALLRAAAGALRIDPVQITSLQILRRSLDCRAKPRILAVYTVLVSCRGEARVRRRICSLADVTEYRETVFSFSADGTQKMRERPVIIGSGPAGLFCALFLARAGYRPIVAERGKDVDARIRDVEAFWRDGTLNPESNLQFGEGGAGTFSDGKLSTGVKDRDGRCRAVLQEFVRAGADPDILIDSHPHVGTDTLIRILKKIRQEITECGGIFCFSSRLDDIAEGADGCLLLKFSDGTSLHTQTLVPAIGNGAQDTFRMLHARRIPMEQKAFAVGLRIEHPQLLIDENAYGDAAGAHLLPHASYKLTARSGGRGVYSFCMCPGGYVVQASSVPGQTVVNGMSYHDRSGINANAAIVMSVNGADFGSDDPLAGLVFQQCMERRAYELCPGRVPQQRLGDFAAGKCSAGFGGITPQLKGRGGCADLSMLFSQEMKDAFLDAMKVFGRRIPGFNDPDAVLSGVESRTSSPVRMPRSESCVSADSRIYPCGEGAGYAGGIVSAAMDGIRCAQQIAHIYRPFDEER